MWARKFDLRPIWDFLKTNQLSKFIYFTLLFSFNDFTLKKLLQLIIVSNIGCVALVHFAPAADKEEAEENC